MGQDAWSAKPLEKQAYGARFKGARTLWEGLGGKALGLRPMFGGSSREKPWGLPKGSSHCNVVPDMV